MTCLMREALRSATKLMVGYSLISIIGVNNGGVMFVCEMRIEDIGWDGDPCAKLGLGIISL